MYVREFMSKVVGMWERTVLNAVLDLPLKSTHRDQKLKNYQQAGIVHNKHHNRD